MKPEDNLLAWKVINSLALGGGIKRAAMETDLDLSQCTRLIQHLEAELSARLTTRNTRPITLTDLGMALLPDIQAMLSHQDRIMQRLEALNGQTMTVLFGMPANTPRESTFQICQSYRSVDPGLSFSILSDMTHEDIQDGRVDMAYLPYTPRGLPNFDIFPVGTMVACPVAAPEYLAKHGVPTHPDDLREHDVILRDGPHYPKTTWLEKGTERIPLKFRNVYEGDALSCRQAALSGHGISLDVSYAVIRREIKSGLLRPVLNGWHRPTWYPSLGMLSTHPQHARLLKFARFFLINESKQVESRRREVQAVLASLMQVGR